MNALVRASKSAGFGGHRPDMASALAVTCRLSLTSGRPVLGRTCFMCSNPELSADSNGDAASFTARSCSKNSRDASNCASMDSSSMPCPTTVKKPTVVAASQRASATAVSSGLERSTIGTA